jgi:hypothetical protein
VLSGALLLSSHLNGATKDQAQNSNAAPRNTQDMETTWRTKLRKGCYVCSEAKTKPPRATYSTFRAIVSSQPWIQLTGGPVLVGGLSARTASLVTWACWPLCVVKHSLLDMHSFYWSGEGQIPILPLRKGSEKDRCGKRQTCLEFKYHERIMI